MLYFPVGSIFQHSTKLTSLNKEIFWLYLATENILEVNTFTQMTDKTQDKFLFLALSDCTLINKGQQEKHKPSILSVYFDFYSLG